MINVQIDENTFLNMLLDRLEYFTSDEIVLELYKKYYSSLIDNGIFEHSVLDINSIVDNDYINYTQVCTPEEYQEQFNSSTEILVEIKKNEQEYLLVSTY